MGTLQTLRSLNLASNALTGTIPDSLAFSNLEYLNLAGNNFQGEIPNFNQSPNLSKQSCFSSICCDLRDIGKKVCLGSLNKNQVCALDFGISTCPMPAKGKPTMKSLQHFDQGQLSNGQVGGIIVGISLLVVLAFALIYLFWVRRRTVDFYVRDDDVTQTTRRTSYVLPATWLPFRSSLESQEILQTLSSKVDRDAFVDETGLFIGLKQMLSSPGTKTP